MDASSSLPPGRKWLQFQLRHLAIVTLLVAVGCWWFFRGQSGVHKTGRELDVAIFGRGYFVCTHQTTGANAYTRNGHLSLNSQGQICVGRSNDDWLLEPNMTIPSEFTSIAIAPDGNMCVSCPNQSQMTCAGQLALATFMDSEGMNQIANGLYTPTMDVPRVDFPGGQSGAGFLQQGYLESTDGHRTDTTTVLLAALCGLMAWLAWEVRCLRSSLRTDTATML